MQKVSKSIELCAWDISKTARTFLWLVKVLMYREQICYSRGIKK